MIKKALIKLIQKYQAFFSPDHSHYPHGPNIKCRFHPTCSEYAKLSLEKYPLYKAVPKIIWRILRCNPYSKGGVDNP